MSSTEPQTSSPLDQLEALVSDGKESEVTSDLLFAAAGQASTMAADAIARAASFHNLMAGLLEEYAATTAKENA